MHEDVFTALGLSKNEAAIYETLVIHGESSVERISRKSKVYRRNVYDTLNRLMEKGLVFEILEGRQNRYQAVEPDKLMEIVQEKEQMLAEIMPVLKKQYSSIPHKQEVFVYRGPEGWKNYMRDILRTGKDFYSLGAKGAWLDPRVETFFKQFIKEAKKKNIKMHHLFDHEVKDKSPDILKHIGSEYKFLPKDCSAPATVDFFGDRVYIESDIKPGGFAEDFSITVIVNQQIADAFRSWFQLIWNLTK